MCSTEPVSSSERSTRITHPISPRSTVTRTRDFSGTKPRTAGKAAIRTPGRFRRKSGDCECHAPTVVGSTHGYARPDAARCRRGDEFAVGDESGIELAVAAQLHHGVAEHVSSDVVSGSSTAGSCSHVALTRVSPICAASVRVLALGVRRRHGLLDGIGVFGVNRRRRQQGRAHRRRLVAAADVEGRARRGVARASRCSGGAGRVTMTIRLLAVALSMPSTAAVSTRPRHGGTRSRAESPPRRRGHRRCPAARGSTAVSSRTSAGYCGGKRSGSMSSSATGIGGLFATVPRRSHSPDGHPAASGQQHRGHQHQRIRAGTTTAR